MQGCFSGHKPKAASRRRLRRKAVSGQFYEFGDVAGNAVGSRSCWLLYANDLGRLFRQDSRAWKQSTENHTSAGRMADAMAGAAGTALSVATLGRRILAGLAGSD